MYKKRAEHAKSRNEMQLCRDFVGIVPRLTDCGTFHVIIYGRVAGERSRVRSVAGHRGGYALREGRFEHIAGERAACEV